MNAIDNDKLKNPPTAQQGRGPLDKFFEITSRGSTVKQEIRGGIVAFVAMAYIVVLNPLILGGSADVDGARLDGAQLTAVTGLVSPVMIILFAALARLPFAVASGLGMNSFQAVAVLQDDTWPEAMGLTVINGAIIVIIGPTAIRTAIFPVVIHAINVATT